MLRLRRKYKKKTVGKLFCRNINILTRILTMNERIEEYCFIKRKKNSLLLYIYYESLGSQKLENLIIIRSYCDLIFHSEVTHNTEMVSREVIFC